MTIARDAVFLLTCADPDKKKVFGTGFAVAHRDEQLYLLTCAHVVDDLNRKVMANGYEAEIVETGSRDTIDLALLRISYKNKETPPLLNRANRGKPDKRFQLCGYGLFRGAKDNHARREIQGSLGEDLGLTFDVGKSSIEAWELKIDPDDPLSKLQPGYSGSPLCDEDGRLIGVVSHEGGGGKFGYAVGISNLQTIYPEIEHLIPSFSAPHSALCSAASSADRIALAKKQLRSLLPDFDIDDKLYDKLTKAVRNEFKRMDEKGLCPEDEALLEKIGNAADRPDEWEVLVRFLESLDRKRQDIAEGPDYGRLAKQLARGEVILCLGQEISHLLGAQIPSTAEIKKCLCQGGCQAPLSELCEQKLISPGSSRTDLVHEFRELMDRKTSSVVLHEV
ncbi:MAG: serine protease, partial [Candidatus Electrothrix sp.]